MPWPKKYPGLAGAINPSPITAQPKDPSIAPVGVDQPGLAAPAMGGGLKLPQPPKPPMAPALGAPSAPNLDEVKKRALQNIAMGRKGF